MFLSNYLGMVEKKAFLDLLCHLYVFPTNNSGLYRYISIQKDKISNEINSLMCPTE